MTTIPLPLCYVCARRRAERIPHRDDPASDPTCDAFPNGIPAAIIEGGDHRKAWPGDNGIQFELEKGAELPTRFR